MAKETMGVQLERAQHEISRLNAVISERDDQLAAEVKKTKQAADYQEMYRKKADEAEKQIDQAHALLDALPGAPAQEVKHPDG